MPNTPDWGAIETAYSAGVLSLRKIEALYNISEGAIARCCHVFAGGLLHQ